MSKHVTLEDYNGICTKYEYGIVAGTYWTPIDNFNMVKMADDYPTVHRRYIEVLNDNLTSLTIDGTSYSIESDDTGDYVEFALDTDSSTYTVTDNLGGSATFNIVSAYTQRAVELDSEYKLYRGHVNDVTDMFEFDYTVSYHGLEVTEIYLDKYAPDSVFVDIHVLPDSSEGIVATDVRLEVPVVTKVITHFNQLEGFDYAIMAASTSFNGDTLIVNSNVELIGDGVTIYHSTVKNNGE